MPSAETILTGLTTIANDWRWLAAAWHVLLAAQLLAFAAGRRPSVRTVGYLLLAPLLSVSLLAWLSGNPFNATVFILLTVTLGVTATSFPSTPIQLASPVRVTFGIALVIFGSTYPHFLRTDTWTTYLYAAPLGLLPCPTLSAVIGLTLVFQNLCSRRWGLTLLVAGLLYGTIGVFRLGVSLDWGLLIASVLLGTAVARTSRSTRADRSERTRPLPGDHFIANPVRPLTHAITIGRAPQEVWPWLIQMGAGSRAGWYSYDIVDNGWQPSATRLVPELQEIKIGTVFPALPGATDAFVVLAFEPSQSLILGWLDPDGHPRVTWAFVLEARLDTSTRLIVRVRAEQGYSLHGLPEWLSRPLIRFVHFVMQRTQLLGVAQRVESSDAVTSITTFWPNVQEHRP
jgi:hypothetical protein